MRADALRIAVLFLGAILSSSPRAEAPPASDDPLRHGHALLIGVSKYDDRRWPALQDVTLQVDELRRGLQGHFDTVDVVRNLDSDSIRRQLANFLDKYDDEPAPRLFVYYAGHGYTELIVDRNELRGYVTGTDTPAVDGTAKSYDAARHKAISMGEIRELLVESRAKSIFFLFDSCFAGTIFTDRSRQGQQPLSKDRVAQLIEKPARDIITAGSSSQTVPAHSPIPDLFLAAINGEADSYKSGIVSTSQIHDYLLDQIRGPGLTPQGGRLDDPKFAEGRFLFRVLIPPQLQDADRIDVSRDGTENRKAVARPEPGVSAATADSVDSFSIEPGLGEEARLIARELEIQFQRAGLVLDTKRPAIVYEIEVEPRTVGRNLDGPDRVFVTVNERRTDPTHAPSLRPVQKEYEWRNPNSSARYVAEHLYALLIPRAPSQKDPSNR